MGNVAIVTATAVSIFGQGKLLSRLLSANGIQNIVNMNIDIVSVMSYATRNKVSNVFYFYDPFVLPHNTFGLPRRNVVNYWTADGVLFIRFSVVTLGTCVTVGLTLLMMSSVKPTWRQLDATLMR